MTVSTLVVSVPFFFFLEWHETEFEGTDFRYFYQSAQFLPLQRYVSLNR